MEYFRYKRTLQWMSVVLDDWRAWGYRSNIKSIVASTNCLNDWQIDYRQCYWGLMPCFISDNFINFVSYIEMQSKIIRLYLFWYFLSIPCFAKCDYFATTYVIVVSRHFCSVKPHVRKSSRTRDIFAECVSIWSLPWLFVFAKCDYFAINYVIRVSR
jgi:hypothetical protein